MTSRSGFAMMVAILVAIPMIAGAVAQATPEASPAATPVASPVALASGCDGLPVYFQQLASLTLGNEGLVIMRGVGYDALALSEAEATTVVSALDALIPDLEAMTPPEPAAAYHVAYLEMMAWYRALAADRDAASHQRLINDDRRLFGLMGMAIQAGQAECGYVAWNDAREAAFPPEE